MEIQILQHTKLEPPGIIGNFLDQEGIPFSVVPLYETNELPAVPATHLVVLGGPMSVHDEAQFPFLAEEKRQIREFARKDKPLLGICLGAQLIASAHGAEVKHFIPEMGWYPLETVEPLLPSLPNTFHAFQFHEDTFAIPPGGRLLCTGAQVTNQALVYGRAVGFQFHLEMTGEMIDEWTRHLPRSERDQIQRDTGMHLAASNRICEGVVRSFISGFY